MVNHKITGAEAFEMWNRKRQLSEDVFMPRKRTRSRSPRNTPQSAPPDCPNIVVLPHAFNSPRFSDVIVVGPSGRRFYCHRIVLAACCDYFDSIFDSGMREAEQQEVHLSEAENDQVLELLLQALYAGSSIYSVMSSEVGPLYRLANYLGATGIAQRCVTYMQDRCSSENAISFYSYVAGTPAEALVSGVCLQAISKNFAQLGHSIDFLSLQIDLVLKLARGDANEGLEVLEREMFYVLMAWVERDLVNREQHLANILRLVRFPTMAPAELSSLMHHPIASKVQPLFKDLLLQAFAAHAGQLDGIDEFLRQPRLPMRGCFWNPADKSAQLVLDEGSLTVRGRWGDSQPFIQSAVRATVGFDIAFERRYWEVEVLDASNVRGMIVGLARKEAPLFGSRWACFSGPDGWGICLDDGSVRHGTCFEFERSAIWHLSTGSRIGILGDRGSITFYLDGTRLGTPFTALSGTVFPAAYIHKMGQAIRVDFEVTSPEPSIPEL